MEILNYIDSIPLILFVSWWFTKRHFHKQYQPTKTHNKHTLYLTMLAGLLQIYFYAILSVIMIVLILYLFKIIILEPIALISDGHYPFNVEHIMRHYLFKVFSSKDLMMFHMIAFTVINIFIYTTIMFIFEDTQNEQTKKAQTTMLLNSVLYLYVFIYFVWLSFVTIGKT
jgi:hypothetical protein